MGYSISMKFKTEGQKAKVLQFINDNKDIINQTVRLSFLGSIRLPNFEIDSFLEDQNIPYGPRGKNLIGWKDIGIPQGLHAFVVFMSSKCGQDFYYYDNKKYKIVLSENFDENLMTTQINQKGIVFKEEILPEKGLLKKMMEYAGEEENKCQQLMKNLEILDENWNNKLEQEQTVKNKKKM